MNILFHTFFGLILFFIQLFLKAFSGMANSVDPDQTAPSGAVWSGSALFAYALLSETLVYEISGDLPKSILLPGDVSLKHWLNGNNTVQTQTKLPLLGLTKDMLDQIFE